MDNLPINPTDLAVIVVLLLSALVALVRGFVHELLSLLAWIGAALATVYGLPYVQPYTREVIAIPLIADIISGVGLFLVVLVVLSVTGRLVARGIQKSGLGPLDRSLGLLFGVLRGVLLVSVAWLLMVWALPNVDERPTWIAEAKSGPLLTWGAWQVNRLLPGELRRSGAEVLGQMQAQMPGVTLELQPPPKDDAPAEQPGYKDAEREDMERLIENAQPSTSGSGDE